VCAAHPEVELGPQPPLLGVSALQAPSQDGILGGGARPALDAAARLEPGHRRDELGTSKPERRRERLAVVVERALLRDGRLPERTTDDDPREGAWWPA
jgi:hypothetical protein